MSLISGSLPVTQILMQHIRAILPDLKLCISTQMIMLQKELTSYMGSSLIPSQVKGALLLSIITKYSYGFQSIVDGKYEEWSTIELSGVACFQYIFQTIFVTSLEVYILLILDTGCYTGDVMSTYLSVLEHVLQICFPMWLVHLLSEVVWKLWEWLCMLIPLYTCILTLTKLSSTTWVLSHV